MQKRNIILLIIILVIITIIAFVFLYSQNNTPINQADNPDFFSQFNPFKQHTVTPVVKPPVEIPNYQPNPVVTQKKKLTKISSMPVAGFTVFMKERLKNIAVITPTTDVSTTASATTKKTTKPTPPPTEFVTALRYVDSATGNIYQTFLDNINERKFSTTIIPKVNDAYFANNGESVVMRYLKGDGRTIETFVGTLPKEILGGDTTETNEIKGVFLPDNVKDISVSPDNLKMFYLFENNDIVDDNTSIIGTTLNFSNNAKVQIFDSPFTEWLSSWPNSNTIALTTKPSSMIPGYMYSMDGAGKNLTETLGNINGLTTLEAPNGKMILYGDGNLSLNIYHTDTRISDPLGVKTLPEKCVWNKTSDAIYCAVPKLVQFGQYPDTWYQGEVSFNDQLWKIDAKTGNATLLMDPGTFTEGKEEVDGVKLALDEGENYLFFINKKDSFLWKLDLK